MPTSSSENIKQILSIDIGGSHVKATILDKDGQHINDYEKIPTPSNPFPERLLDAVKEVTKVFKEYDCISVGFPGFVKNGIVFTAPNLGTENWKAVDFRKMIEDELGKPTKLVNDADMQGLGVVKGRGLEMVITLGTGFGSALLLDGKLLPHLEIAHHPVCKDKDYDAYIGDKALESKGTEKWNERVQYIFKVLKTVFNYDVLYIGGGNASKLNFKLDDNMVVINNREGIKGGARLWIPFREKQLTDKI